MGRPTRLAAASMMRRLAWCGTKRSTSSALKPLRDRIPSVHSANIRTATLNTSAPFIFTKCMRVSTVSWVVGWREPPPGM